MASFYNNNPLLKSIGQVIPFTQDQVQEFIKCKGDPIYFIENYVKVISLDYGLVPFRLHDYQKKLITAYKDEDRIIALIGRQMGKTVSSAAFILWYSLFQSNKTIAILANKSSAAREVLSRYQYMYESLPLWLQQGVKIWNKGDVELENGSKVFTAATTGSGIRGKSVNLLYVDETAAIPNTIAEDFFTATYPVISAGKTTKVILTSTPIGYNHFYKFWSEAEQGINGFIPIRADYWEHPDRDEKWAQEQRELLGDVKFSQEVLCVGGKTQITLRDSETGNIINTTIEDAYDLLKNTTRDGPTSSGSNV